MSPIKIPSGQWTCVECSKTFEPSNKNALQATAILPFDIVSKGICDNGHQICAGCLEKLGYKTGKTCKICSKPVQVLTSKQLYDILFK